MPGRVADIKQSGDARRALPAVSALLDQPAVLALLAQYPRPLVLDAIRAVFDEIRSMKEGGPVPGLEDVLGAVTAHLADMELDRLRPVINATGIILHTGLGRAALPVRAAEGLGALNRYCNLQIDLEAGLRGKRNYTTESLLCRLTGAEAALVVNNNAAATLLVLKALCAGCEVIVSRGQLIEIGGSYRLPDCVHESGARLIEVGTTNKTHLRDYAHAITHGTAALMRVNPSNYRVVGFAKSVPVEELVTLKAGRDLLVIDDLGCGALIDLAAFGLPHEPMVQESIAAGADIALFSGDKLIGGPQSGIIVGKRELVQRIKKHPLTRMLRVDKLTDMALEQTLRLFLDPERLLQENPTLRALSVSPQELERQSGRLVEGIRAAGPAFHAEAVACESALGGGSLPATPLPSFAARVTWSGGGADTLSRCLRRMEPPLIARVREDAVLLDVRTLLPGDVEAIVEGFRGLADS